jgi:hypothetical protein
MPLRRLDRAHEIEHFLSGPVVRENDAAHILERRDRVLHPRQALMDRAQAAFRLRILRSPPADQLELKLDRCQAHCSARD